MEEQVGPFWVCQECGLEEIDEGEKKCIFCEEALPFKRWTKCSLCERDIHKQCLKLHLDHWKGDDTQHAELKVS